MVNVGKARLKSGLFRKPTEYLTQSNIFALMSLRDHRLGAAFRKSGRSILQAQLHSLDLAILMEGFPNECTLIWILEVHAFSKPCFFFSPLAPGSHRVFSFRASINFQSRYPFWVSLKRGSGIFIQTNFSDVGWECNWKYVAVSQVKLLRGQGSKYLNEHVCLQNLGKTKTYRKKYRVA